MEKDSRKNQKIHKNVGLFKSTIERKTRIKIRELDLHFFQQVRC